jgi:hypothetical protein
MTKPTTESRPARHTDDAERAAIEACQLLGLGDDPSRLCPTDRLRCDLVAALRVVVDHAAATAMEGGSADVGRLVTAVEQLVRLLPPKSTEAPSHRADPRAALFDLIMEQRARAGIPDEGLDERDDELAALKAEVEQLRAVAMAAGLAVPHAACAAPTDVDIVPPGERADRDAGPRPGPDDKPPHVTIDADAIDIRNGFNNDTPQPWRRFSHLYE